MIKKIFQQLKERKVTKWLAIYTSTCVTIIYLSSLFSTRYNLPPQVFNITIATIIFGFFIILIYKWNHGNPEKVKLRKLEIVYYSILGILYIYIILNIAGAKEIIPFSPSEGSIAVLPFNNFGDSKEDEFFSDGVTEDILTQLAKMGQLKVVSRTSVMKYKNTTKNIKEIANELGVKNILEGSIRRSGDKVRIVAQLIDAQNDDHLWAETYDREMKDIFQIQSDVAKKIAEQLKVKLTETEKERINRMSTKNIDAYTFYLKGKEFYYRYSSEDNDKAIELFQKAIKVDSNYALAFAGLANAYAQRYGIYDMGKEWLDTSLAMSLRAIELDPDVAEPYKSLGVVYFYSGDLDKAISNYRKAIDINPNLVPAMTNLSVIYWLKGNYPEAKHWVEKSISIEVKRSTNYRFLGLIYQGLCDYENAEKNLLKVLELQPNQSFVINDLTKLYLTSNQLDKAKKMLADTHTKKPEDFRVLSAMGDFELYTGNYTKAEEYYQKAINLSSIDYGPATEYAFLIRRNKLNESNKIFNKIIKDYSEEIESGNEDFNYPYDLARIYSVMNQEQQALYYFNEAVKDGFRLYSLAELEPMFDNIKNEPAFKMKIDWMKKEVEQMQKIISAR